MLGFNNTYSEFLNGKNGCMQRSGLFRNTGLAPMTSIKQADVLQPIVRKLFSNPVKNALILPHLPECHPHDFRQNANKVKATHAHTYKTLNRYRYKLCRVAYSAFKLGCAQFPRKWQCSPTEWFTILEPPNSRMNFLRLRWVWGFIIVKRPVRKAVTKKRSQWYAHLVQLMSDYSYVRHVHSMYWTSKQVLLSGFVSY